MEMAHPSHCWRPYRSRFCCGWVGGCLFWGYLIGAGGAGLLLNRCAGAESIRVGVAKVDITPQHPVVLAGYGSRTTEGEQIESKLWARAIFIDSGPGALIIAVDTCGFPRSWTDQVAHRLRTNHGMTRAQIVISATHTHNAPSLRGYAPILWQGRMTAAQEQHMDQYTNWLADQVVDVARQALAAAQPASLSWGQGRLAWGGNRRVLQQGQWVTFGFQKTGPVDHALPLVLARDGQGRPLAIWANYAAHCTSRGDANVVGGDWVGFANQALEEQFPQAMPLITIGCGADVGPQPSGSSEISRSHGVALAQEVTRLIQTTGTLTSLHAPLQVAMRDVPLPLSEVPERAAWVEQLQHADPFHRQRAQSMLAQLDQPAGRLPTQVALPLTIWKFGPELAVVMLGGEVCVDYALRLKQSCDWRRLAVHGWCNDVPCYIASRQVLLEGGYEADFSMVYYNQPSRFALEVEETLVEAIVDMLGDEYRADAQLPTYPYGVRVD